MVLGIFGTIGSNCEHDIISSFYDINATSYIEGYFSCSVQCVSSNSRSILHCTDGRAAPAFDCSITGAPPALDHSANRLNRPVASQGGGGPPSHQQPQVRPSPIPAPTTSSAVSTHAPMAASAIIVPYVVGCASQDASSLMLAKVLLVSMWLSTEVMTSTSITAVVERDGRWAATK
jgi:hypothetical protein